MNSTPPSAVDIERVVLGDMLFDAEAIDAAMELIGPEVFYNPRHGIICKAIFDLRLADSPVDQLTLSDKLKVEGNLENIGGEAVIAALVGEFTATANIEYHCRVLLDKYHLRSIIGVAAGLRETCFESAGSTGSPTSMSSMTVAQSGIDQLVQILDDDKSKPYQPLKEAVMKAHTRIVETAGMGKITGITTGFHRLDRLLDGLGAGKLIIVAGLTSMGKTALALNFLTNAAKAGHPVGMFSLEMDVMELALRLFAIDAGVNFSEVRYRIPTSTEWEDLAAGSNRLSKLPVYFDDTPGISLPTLSARARKMQRERGIQMLVVDYLQLMEGVNKESRQLEVTSISRGLKSLAKTLKIPILALSQLSRKANETEHRRPRLSDLRESGAIEQDSDVVLFIHNPADDDKRGFFVGSASSPAAGSTPTPDELNHIRSLIIDKNRGGCTGEIPVYWDTRRLRFSELEIGGHHEHEERKPYANGEQ